MAHRGAQVRYAWDPLPPKSAVLASRRPSVRTNASASSATPTAKTIPEVAFLGLRCLCSPRRARRRSALLTPISRRSSVR